METIAQRDVEIRNLRLDVQRVRILSHCRASLTSSQLSDEANAIRQEKASVQALLDSATAQRKILEVRSAPFQVYGYLPFRRRMKRLSARLSRNSQ
jgi:hypothetical protein